MLAPSIPIIDDLGLSRSFRIAIDSTIFLISLYSLERSADVFVDSAAVIGKRFGIPTVLVGLLTAGAEWEEVSPVTDVWTLLRAVPVRSSLSWFRRS